VTESLNNTSSGWSARSHDREERSSEDTSFDVPVGPIYLKNPFFGLHFVEVGVDVSISRPDYPSAYAKCRVIFFHLHVFGLATGFMTMLDRWGRSCVLGPPELRSKAVRAAADQLLSRKAAHTLWSRFLTTAHENSNDCLERDEIVIAALREPERLRIELPGSADDFLQALTKKSRRSLRYYRNKLDDDFQCKFVPAMSDEQTLSAIRELNSGGRYTISYEMAFRRFYALQNVEGSFNVGLQDRTGRWISVIGGWRRGRSCYIVWQLNLDMPEYSVSNSMRYHQLEDEISKGTKYIVFVGGTSGMWSRACIEDQSESVLAFRSSPLSRLMCVLICILRPNSRMAQLYRTAHSAVAARPDAVPVRADNRCCGSSSNYK
jgi:hypothetical protein